MAALPPYLLNAWRLEHGEEDRAKEADALKDCAVSSLAEAYIKAQLDKHSHQNELETSSLSSIAVGRTLDVLHNSDDQDRDASLIAENLSSTTLRQVLEDPRIPYQVLRVFLKLPQTIAVNERRIVDVDEAIILNERYIRSRDNKDGKYLVSLEDLCDIASDSNPAKGTRKSENKPAIATMVRKDPPKGGLEVLDYHRPRRLELNSSSASFSKVFDRITKGVLRGLDWRYVMVAGGMALTTLLHVYPSKDDDIEVKDPDIDIYIYGLGPEEANRKAEEIHDVWARNLPASATKRLVVKNAKTINLLTSYPNRRIQIVLKLLPTPTDILLNFDLDACAVGFDGTRVFMLPRCARAIETGYSVFTMDLIWGHHLGDRRASQDSRVFKYADRGFGIRFLPSYARSLEEDGLESTVSQSPFPSKPWEELTPSERSDFSIRQRFTNRKPAGQEPGLKTLRRIAYLGWDYPHRFYFGTTPLQASPAQEERQLEAEGISEMYVFSHFLSLLRAFASDTYPCNLEQFRVVSLHSVFALGV